MNVSNHLSRNAFHLPVCDFQESLIEKRGILRPEKKRQETGRIQTNRSLKKTQLDKSITQFATDKLPQTIFGHFYSNQSIKLKEITPLIDIPETESLLNETLAPIENIRRAFFLTIAFAGFSTFLQLNWNPAFHAEQYNASFNWQKIATNAELPLLYDLCQKYLGVSQTAASTLLGFILAYASSIKMPDACTGLWGRALREFWGNALHPLVAKKENDSLHNLISVSSIMNRISSAFELSLLNSWWTHSGLSFEKFNDNLNAWKNQKPIIGTLALLAPTIKKLSKQIYIKIKGPEFQEDLISGKVDANWKAFLALPNLQATANQSKGKVAVLATFRQKGREFSLPFTVAAKGKGKYSYEILGTSKNIQEYLSCAVSREFSSSSEPVTYRLRTFIQK